MPEYRISRKQIIINAIKTRFKPSTIEDNDRAWYDLDVLLWKLTIDDLDLLERFITSHRPDVPDSTCI